MSPDTAGLFPPSNPARGYSEAVERLSAWQAADAGQVYPLNDLQYLLHKDKTPRAIVLLHGYTNGPKQFTCLRENFFQAGYNVIIPRAPHHGLLDRLSTRHGRLTTRELTGYMTEAVDIAQGLGEQVTVAGLSMGGVLAGWAAQRRADVHLAAMIAPACGFQAIPARLTRLVTGLFLRLPNRFVWWDAQIKARPHPPYHAYPRYATRAPGSILHLAQSLQAEAGRRPPQARSVLLITNPCDEAVDNAATCRLMQRWQAAGAQNVQAYAFDPDLDLVHDLIDPEQPMQKIEIVYPILLNLLVNN